MIFIVILVLPLVAYLILNGYFTAGLYRLLQRDRPASFHRPVHGGVSVVVAARNESAKLPALVEALRSQHDPSIELELIICDDYSEDGTADISAFVSVPFPIRIFSSKTLGLPPGKKHALDHGIRAARYDLILITDADTCPGTGWVQAYRDAFADPDVRFAAGLVGYHGPFRGFQGVEALDFYGLAAASAGAAGNGSPFMCNAANMGFRKDAYISAGGIVRKGAPSSGDDVMLLHSILKAYGSGAVRWVADSDAVVHTSGTDSLWAFFRQRVRWASKSKAYRNKMAILTAITVLSANFAIMFGVLLSLFGFVGPALPFWLIGIKLVADYPLLRMITRHYKQHRLLWQFLPASLLYPWYTSAVGILSFYWKPVWKGRVIR